MTDPNFNAAYAAYAAQQTPPPLHDPAFIAHHILARDRMRTRLLAAASLLLWLIGLAGLILLIVGLNEFIIGVRIDHLMPFNTAAASHSAANPQEFDFALQETDLLHHSIPYITGSIAALLLAALCTVMLIFSSRQATLNQINLSLGRIAEQLARGTPAASPAADFAGAPTSYYAPAHGSAWPTLIFAAIVVLTALATGVFYAVHPPAISTRWQNAPRLAPYSAIRWQGASPQVQVDGTWYELLAIDDLPVTQIITLDQSLDPRLWKKHFNEDLVELMTTLNHPPQAAVNLTVKDLPTGPQHTLANVPMTESNRRAILDADFATPPDAPLPATGP